MSYQLIYSAIKQYSGNKVRGGDQSASLFSSPGYGKIDLSNKAFWKQCMDLFGIHQRPLSILFNIGFSSQGKCSVLNTVSYNFTISDFFVLVQRRLWKVLMQECKGQTSNAFKNIRLPMLSLRFYYFYICVIYFKFDFIVQNFFSAANRQTEKTEQTIIYKNSN